MEYTNLHETTFNSKNRIIKESMKKQEKEIGILGVLDEKTRKDIDLFVINSYLSVDKNKVNKFYSLIQRVIVESMSKKNKWDGK